MKFSTFLIVAIFITPLTIAGFGYNIETGTTITYRNFTSLNNTNFWDNLDTPADILGSLINNDLGWVSTSGEEPNWDGNYTIFTGLIQNTSYLDTYNATYDSLIESNGSFVPYTNATLNVDLGTKTITALNFLTSNSQFVNSELYSTSIIIIVPQSNDDYSVIFDSSGIHPYNSPLDLGKSAAKFGNLYLSGNLSDGTNDITVADIVTWAYNMTAMTYTNLAFTNETNIFTKNQNMSVNNVTDVDCIEFSSGGKICSL